METTGFNTSTANDVLHFERHNQLSAEEIAKAIAHHKRHHGGSLPQNTPAKTGAGKKHKA